LFSPSPPIVLIPSGAIQHDFGPIPGIDLSPQGHIPASVGRYSEEKNYPPKYKNTSHPELVALDAELLRKDLCSGRQQDIHSPKLGNAA